VFVKIVKTFTFSSQHRSRRQYS